MDENAVKILGFALGDQWFGMDISMVREVVEWSDLTTAPKSPKCAMGVFNYHGRIITVVDLSFFFDTPAKPLSPDTRIVVLSGDEYSIGFKVDHAEKIETFPRDVFPAGQERKPEKNFIKAVAPTGDKVYNLIDLRPLLDSIEEEFSSANTRG